MLGIKIWFIPISNKFRVFMNEIKFDTLISFIMVKSVFFT